MLETGVIAVGLLTAATILGLAYSVDPDTVLVEPISVPEELEGMGLSSKVVSDRITAEMHRIHQITETQEKGRGVGLGSKKTVVSALEEELDVAGGVWIARNLLGIEQFRIQGEIVQWGDDLEFRLRGFRPGSPMKVVIKWGTLDDFGSLITKVAAEAFRFVDPFVLAAYHFHQEELTGDFTETLGAIEAGLDPDPGDEHQAHNLKRIHNLWARVLLVDYDYERAAEKLQIAVALDPEYGAAYQTWGEVLYAQKRYREAIEMCRLAVQHDPGLAGAYSVWGDALHNLGYRDEAQSAYGVGMRLNPRQAHAYFERGDLYFRLGQYEAALREYESAVALDPQDVSHRYNIRTTRLRIGISNLDAFHALR